MAIRASYRVDPIPKAYTTEKTTYRYITDPEYDMQGHVPGTKIPKVRLEEKVIEEGGWLFTFPRGHQIRCTSEEQIKLLGLSTSPRLIDDATGLEVNEHGIPVDIADHVRGATNILNDGGAPDTVQTLVARGGGKDPIAAAIDETE